MLLTDCFPPVGTTGLAAVGQACRSAKQAEYIETSTPGNVNDCIIVAATGNCASGRYKIGLPVRRGSVAASS